MIQKNNLSINKIYHSQIKIALENKELWYLKMILLMVSQIFQIKYNFILNLQIQTSQQQQYRIKYRQADILTYKDK